MRDDFASALPEQVRAIHRLHRAGLSHYKIHRRVGVSKGAVGRVLRGEIKSLAHVSIELPEDEIDVWDAEASAAWSPTPPRRTASERSPS